MKGHRSIFLEGGGAGDLLISTLVPCAIGVVASVLAAGRFRADETREFFV